LGKENSTDKLDEPIIIRIGREPEETKGRDGVREKHMGLGDAKL
jgi:hypothetical protein